MPSISARCEQMLALLNPVSTAKPDINHRLQDARDRLSLWYVIEQMFKLPIK